MLIYRVNCLVTICNHVFILLLLLLLLFVFHIHVVSLSYFVKHMSFYFSIIIIHYET